MEEEDISVLLSLDDDDCSMVDDDSITDDEDCSTTEDDFTTADDDDCSIVEDDSITDDEDSTTEEDSTTLEEVSCIVTDSVTDSWTWEVEISWTEEDTA